MHTGDRFLETTRGQVVAVLRRGPQTVESVSSALGLTDNAIRSHLTSLERDGIIRQRGVRRVPGAGKPATLYEIHPEAELRFSRAYAPILQALVEELTDQLPPESVEQLMQGVGKRLAAAMGGPITGSLQLRVDAVLKLLAGLGGVAETVVLERGVEVNACASCPLAAATRKHPGLCVALEHLLAEYSGLVVREHCERGDVPRCRFEITEAA